MLLLHWPAVRPVMLNLANKFSQRTFSIAEHYGLFSDLIKLFYIKHDGVTDLYNVDRSTKKLLKEKLNATAPTLKLI